MRATVLASLTETCQLLRETQTDDGQGGATTTWPVVASCACDVIPQIVRLVPAQQGAAESVITVTRYSIHVPWNVDVHANDRLQVLTGSYPGFYRVMDEGFTSDALVREVVCQRIT